MRHKSILLIVILLGLALKTFSQAEWFPVGAKWYYNYTSKEGYNEYFTYEVVKDTIISGRECSKLNARRFSYDNNMYDWGTEYVYQDSMTIYHFHKNTFHLLYDFGLKAGDSIDLNLNSELFPHFPDTSSFTHVIDSIGEISIDGVNLKTQYIRLVDEKIHATNDLTFNGLIIEKIGNTSLLFGSPFLVVEMPPWYGPLRCYSDNEISYNNTDMPCDTIIVSVEKHDETSDNVKIYPNPFTKNVWVAFKEPTSFKIKIYSLTGKLVISKNVLNEKNYLFSLDEIEAGFYIMYVKFDDKNIVNKILKIKY